MSDTTGEPSAVLCNLLRDDEKLLWRKTPHRRRLLVDAVRIIGPVFVVLGMIGVFFLWMVALSVEFSGGDPTSILPIAGAVALVVALVVVFAGLWVANRRYDHAEYAATDRRLISLTGAFGRDSSSVDWESVRDLEVTVGTLDGAFGTGTIHVATEGRGDITFRYLEGPHDIAASLDSIRSGETGLPTDEGTTTASETQKPEAETGTGHDPPAGSEENFDTWSEQRERRGRRTRKAGSGAEDVSATIEGLLRDGEKLRWHYRPPARTYLEQSVVGALLSGLVVWSIFYGLFVAVPVFAEFAPLVESTLGVSAVSAIVAGWVLVQSVWVLASSLGAYSACDRLEFAGTDQRAIKVGGMVGLDTSSVDWRNVTDIEVERNLMTKLFHTGNVVVRTGGGGKTYRGGGLRFGPIVDPMAALERIEAIQRGDDDDVPILVCGGTTTPAVVTPGAGSLSSQAQTLLRNGEELLWCGRPSFLPFAAPALVGAIALTAIGVALLSFGWGLFAVFLVFGGVSTGVKRLLSYRNAEYVATDQRVVAFGGAVGRDSSSVDWDDVHDVEVEAGPFDAPFGTGTLRFSRAGRATPAERQQTGGESREAFTGVRFQRVPNARSVAESLERGRTG